jgi:hypothetical protein
LGCGTAGILSTPRTNTSGTAATKGDAAGGEHRKIEPQARRHGTGRVEPHYCPGVALSPTIAAIGSQAA